MKYNISEDNRSISETIGMVLLLIIIILGAVTAYSIGVPILQDRASSSQVDGVEKGFILLDTNIEEHGDLSVNERLVRLGISEGKVSIGDTTSLVITVGSTDYTYESQRIVYKNKQKKIIYDSSSIIRATNNGQVITEGPDINSKEGILHIRTPILTGDGSIESSRSVAIRTTLDTSETQYIDATGKTVSITVTSPYADAWLDRLNEMDGFSCSKSSSNTVSCDIDTINTVQIQTSYIDIRLDR